MNYNEELTADEAQMIERIGRDDPRRSSRNVLDNINGQRRLKGLPCIGQHAFYETLSACGVQNRKCVKGFKFRTWDRKRRDKLPQRTDLLDSVMKPFQNMPDVVEEPPRKPSYTFESLMLKSDPVQTPAIVEEKKECKPEAYIKIIQKILKDWKVNQIEFAHQLHMAVATVHKHLMAMVDEGFLKLSGHTWTILADKDFLTEYASILVPCASSRKNPVRKQHAPHGLADIMVGNFLIKRYTYGGNVTPTSASIDTEIPVKTCFGVFAKFVKLGYIAKDLDGKCWHMVNKSALEKHIADTLAKTKKHNHVETVVEHVAETCECDETVVEPVPETHEDDVPTEVEEIVVKEPEVVQQPHLTTTTCFSIPGGFTKVEVNGKVAEVRVEGNVLILTV